MRDFVACKGCNAGRYCHGFRTVVRQNMLKKMGGHDVIKSNLNFYIDQKSIR